MSLTPREMLPILRPYLAAAPPGEAETDRILSQLSIYLDLLIKWNARLNLTAIREPEEIVRRHFGESLFAGLHLAADCRSLLDFGSGGGFPGVPIQILRPELNLTLAESRQKKAAFLREVARELQLPTEVWADRVEQMPAERTFDVVTLRAVDDMEAAIAAAADRANRALIILGTTSAEYSSLKCGFGSPEVRPIPESTGGALRIYRRM